MRLILCLMFLSTIFISTADARPRRDLNSQCDADGSCKVASAIPAPAWDVAMIPAYVPAAKAIPAPACVAVSVTADVQAGEPRREVHRPVLRAGAALVRAPVKAVRWFREHKPVRRAFVALVRGRCR